MARNVIEIIFGVLKKRFQILLLPPPLKMDDQAWIPVALCALHNFILKHNPEELQEFITEPEIVDVERTGTLRTELPALPRTCGCNTSWYYRSGDWSNFFLFFFSCCLLSLMYNNATKKNFLMDQYTNEKRNRSKKKS